MGKIFNPNLIEKDRGSNLTFDKTTLFAFDGIVESVGLTPTRSDAIQSLFFGVDLFFGVGPS